MAINEKRFTNVYNIDTWYVDASSVSADAVHDGALVDVHAPDVVLVQGVTLKNDFFTEMPK